MIARLERTVPGRLLIWCIVTPVLMLVMAIATLVFMTLEYLLGSRPIEEVLKR